MMDSDEDVFLTQSRFSQEELDGYMRRMGKSINLFEDEAFKGTVGALDAAMKELASTGYEPGTREQCRPITIDEEETLWEKGELGRSKHKKAEPKIVKAFDNQQNKNRCYVHLWEKYTSLCPKTCKHDAFYLAPLKIVKSDCWFMASPVGINTLKTAVKRMCEKAGKAGEKQQPFFEGIGCDETV
ncbi:uncharacterized protein LOC124292047 [Haliotis rubra]|uniref:uncharacterized protein LOC124292047 n=1 Tax=Haliotis rubra TaxID=36100 RepID=UPI001EE50691|nr:uncharacterized protein LOC124292047 [Haliotis rubra]